MSVGEEEGEGFGEGANGGDGGLSRSAGYARRACTRERRDLPAQVACAPKLRRDDQRSRLNFTVEDAEMARRSRNSVI